MTTTQKKCRFGRTHTWTKALAEAVKSNTAAIVPDGVEWVYWCSVCDAVDLLDESNEPIFTDEEVTYDMARRTVNEWRAQLKRTQERQAVLESRGTPANLSMVTFTAGVAEGLATAIREMDRVLDGSPTAAAHVKAAQ